MNLTFKRLHPDAVLPGYAKPGDSGMDLCAVEDMILLPGVPTLVKTGLAVELPPDMLLKGWVKAESGAYKGAWVVNDAAHVSFEAQIRPRSGLALKHGIQVVNAPGTIDSGFRGEIGVILMLTYTDVPIPDCYSYRIRKGDRIAQMVICPVIQVQPQWGEIGETERGEAGFGSTGN